MEDGGGREVAGQEAAGVGQDGAGVDDVQAEEGDRPHPVENLEGESGNVLRQQWYFFAYDA